MFFNILYLGIVLNKRVKMIAFIVVVALIFFAGLYVITEIQKHDPTGCTSQITSCAYSAIKGNGITINNSHDLLVLIVVILVSLALAYLVVRLVKGNKSHKADYNPNPQEGFKPRWFDELGNSQAIAAIYLLSGMALVIIVGWLAFNLLIVHPGTTSHITSQLTNNVNDFVMQVKIELWKLSQLAH